jgi:diacylglycerol kinase (ATP)
VLAGNGALYGGQFRFFHRADNRDSKLDILVYKEAGYRLVLDSLRGLVQGGIDRVSGTAYLQAERFTVRAAEPVPVEVDGELLGRFAEIRFAPAARRLRVIAPEEPVPARSGGWVGSLLGWTRRPAVTPGNP